MTDFNVSKKREEYFSSLHPKEICKEIGLKHHSTLVSFINTVQSYPTLSSLSASVEMANWFYITTGFTSITAAQVGKRLGRSRMSAHRDITALLEGNYWLQSERTDRSVSNRYTLTPHQFVLLEEYIRRNSTWDYLESRILKDAGYPASNFQQGIINSVTPSELYVENV